VCRKCADFCKTFNTEEKSLEFFIIPLIVALLASFIVWKVTNWWKKKSLKIKARYVGSQRSNNEAIEIEVVPHLEGLLLEGVSFQLKNEEKEYVIDPELISLPIDMRKQGKLLIPIAFMEQPLPENHRASGMLWPTLLKISVIVNGNSYDAEINKVLSSSWSIGQG
jgi:hypothetical protein